MDYDNFEHISSLHDLPLRVFVPHDTNIRPDEVLFLATSKTHFVYTSKHSTTRDPHQLRINRLHTFSLETLYQLLSSTPNSSSLEHLVLGPWWTESHGSTPADIHTRLLLHHAHSFPNLRSIFLAEVIQSECMLSIIQHGDVSPLLAAFPKLEHLIVRGSQNLSFGQHAQSDSLTHLTLQTGNLTRPTLTSLFTSYLPSLTHLELWTGREYYGANILPEDLTPLLHGKLFPSLTHLGLRNNDRANELLPSLLSSPLLASVTHLDLSLGNLTNRSTDLLIRSLPTTSLTHLNLTDNYLSQDSIRRIRDAWDGTLTASYPRNIYDANEAFYNDPNINWDTFDEGAYEYLDGDDDEPLLQVLDQNEHIDPRDFYYCAVGE